jgi:hypothetical protein
MEAFTKTNVSQVFELILEKRFYIIKIKIKKHKSDKIKIFYEMKNKF